MFRRRAQSIAFALALTSLTFTNASLAGDHAHGHADDGHARKAVTKHAEDEDGPIIPRAKVRSEPIRQVASTHDDHHEQAPEAAKSATSHGHGSTAESVTAEQSLRWLMNGNTRYTKNRFRADGKSAQDRQRLSNGQHPHAIVLSCSDSRVPPELIFDQALGEIFVIRVAGEAIDSSVVASIEYAVEHLGSHLLVVMGHSQCGAVKAALGAKEGVSAGSADLDRLVGDIRPRLKSVINEPPSQNYEVESAVNADGVARDLLKRSAILRSRVEAGDLMVKPALYRIDTGKVSWY